MKFNLSEVYCTTVYIHYLCLLGQPFTNIRPTGSLVASPSVKVH